MAFEKKDYEAIKSSGQVDSHIYHEMGDSIVVTCLVGIIGELLGKDTTKIIEDYVEKVKNLK